MRKELDRVTGHRAREMPETDHPDRCWFVAYVVALAVCAAFYFVVGAKVIPLPDNIVAIAQRIVRGAALTTIVLAIARAISVYGLARIEGASTRFTLARII